MSSSYSPATIASGASLSGAVSVGSSALTGISIPSSWTAANLTFQGSFDGVTYFDLYDDSGIERQVIAAASRHVTVDPTKFIGLTYIKVRSGTAAAAVIQAAARVLNLVVVNL